MLEKWKCDAVNCYITDDDRCCADCENVSDCYMRCDCIELDTMNKDKRLCDNYMLDKYQG